MVAQIRPNRLDVNDRFPMLGFTIRTDGAPQRAEVAIATEPGLLAAQGKSRRTSSNFYSSRAGGALNIPRGEAVYVVPPEVLARFVGADRLYFGLATAPAGNGAAYQVAAMPTDSSPYISLINLTDRALRRVRLMPNRQQRTAGYGEAGQGGLEWAGDAAMPGAEPTKAANGANGATPIPTNGAPASAPYDDGFGPLPPANSSTPTASVPPPPTNGTANGAPAAASSYYSRGMDAGGVHNADIQTSGDPVAVTPPPIFTIDGWKRELLIGAAEVLTGPVGAFIAGLRASAQLFGVSIGFGPAVGAGFMSGAGLGCGLIFGPGGELGAYGSVELDVGFISSLSATMQVTVVKGGIDAFNGWSNAVAISGGEEIVGGASILFNEKHEFCGVTVQAGVGAGLSPVDIYVSAQQSRAVQVMSMALAYGRTAPAARSNSFYRGARRPAPVWSKSMAARALGDDPLAVDIKYRMFIPSPLIDSPLEVYGGDGRGFSYADGTSRGEIHATVRLTPGGGIDGIDIIDRHWGESTGYATADSYHPEGKPDWWLEKVEGAQPTERKTLQVSDDNLNIAAGASTRRSIQTAIEGSSVVTITAAGSLPLSMTAPDIDATMSVFLRINGSDIEAKVDGSHDGFPCHELYVNGKRLYGYDPVAAGNGPTNLMPPEDIEAVTSWVTVATIGATSQGLAARSRPARAMAGDAWSLNWDDVPLIAQPSSLGCWATAGAMLLSWRDRKGVAPGDVANTCGQDIEQGLDPLKVQAFANALDLRVENPACYTEKGFCRLLETYGPLWVVAEVPKAAGGTFIHAVLVTGMYSDGTETYVRVTDPWDRIVGTPGAPGGETGDHTTGSRYIMTFGGFSKEYEQAGYDLPAGTLFIVHSSASAVAGRTPNRVDGKSAGYAQGLGARRYDARQSVRAMDAENECFSINWDDVELIAQPTEMGCWATSAAMIVGWRDRRSVDPRLLAKSCPIPETAMDDGVTPQQFEELANSLNLISEPAACYTPEGFRQILERSGPLWVAGISPGRHIRVVTGMYGDGTNIYVRITDPWDRVVGTPGAPGPIPDTHNTGSRYIMTYDAFAAEYEAAGAVVPAGTMQILHARPEDIADRTPSRTIGNVPGYAQGLAARAFDAPMLPGLQFSATAWPASAPETLTRECDELLPEDQKVAYWKGLLDSLVGPQTAAKLRDLPAVAKDRGWTVTVSAGATPGVALASAIGSGLVIDPSGQPYTFGIGRLDGGSPPDPFEPKNMAAVTDGKPQITIVEGDTRALMRFGLVCAFRTQDKRVRNGAAILDPAGNFVGATFQLEVNGLKAEDIVDAVKVGYGQTPAKYGTFSKPLGLAQGGLAQGRGARSTVRGLGDEPAPGTTASRVQKDQAGVKFDLAQLSGLVQPQTVPMVAINTPMPGRRVVLNDWPYLDGPGGRTHGDVSIDWAYAAGSVGNIVTDVAGAAAFDGTNLTVTTNIWPVTPVVDPMVAAVCICARFVFSRAGQPDQVAVTEVTVFGDGRDPQRVNRQEQAAPTMPVSPIGA